MKKLEDSVQFIKGVGPKRLEVLKRLGVSTVGDLLYFLPRDYEDRTQITQIARLRVGEKATVQAQVTSFQRYRSKRGRVMAELFVRDDTGALKCVWFNARYLQESHFPEGREMVDIARKRLGHAIVSWRSHGLVRDHNTNRILAELGIQYISDEINWEKHLPEEVDGGLISHPLNVIMDHDHLYHAHRSAEYVARQQADWPFKEDPTAESYTIEAWGDIVERQVDSIQAKGGVATVLMHPVCMHVADGFGTMKRLLQHFAESQTVWARETGAYVPADEGT